MRYFAIKDAGIIFGVGIAQHSGEEITEAEYNHIKSIIDNRPTAPDGFAYRLTAEMEWELYEAPGEEEELTADEALEIILGGEV